MSYCITIQCVKEFAAQISTFEKRYGLICQTSICKCMKCNTSSTYNVSSELWWNKVFAHEWNFIQCVIRALVEHYFYFSLIHEAGQEFAASINRFGERNNLICPNIPAKYSQMNGMFLIILWIKIGICTQPYLHNIKS